MKFGSGDAGRPLLLIEPQSLFRTTVSAVARELKLARVHESSRFDSAQSLLNSVRFDALIIALDQGNEAMDLLGKVRAGEFACPSDLPIVVLADRCDVQVATHLKRLEVRRLLLKPFRVRHIIECIEGLWGKQIPECQ